MRRRRSRSCNALQLTATHCNSNTMIWCADGCHAKSSWRCMRMPFFPGEACVKFSASPSFNIMQHTATHCNTPPHTATHCLQVFVSSLDPYHSQSPCSTLQHTATLDNTLQQSATLCNILQYTTTHCNTL